MKTLLYTTVLLLTLLSSPVFGQTLAQSYKGLVSVKENKTERVDSMLILNLDVKLSGLSIGRYNSLKLTLMLRSGNSSVLLQPIVLNGTNKHNMYERALELKGSQAADSDAYVVVKNDPALLQEISYNKVVPFEPWMEKAELVLVGNLLHYNGTLKNSFTDVLTECIGVK